MRAARVVRSLRHFEEEIFEVSGRIFVDMASKYSNDSSDSSECGQPFSSSTISVGSTYWPIAQENGQRIIGPPKGWIGLAPPNGTEIYLSGIKRTWNGEELLRILCRYGRLYNIRLMMDFSGANRGFGFARFATQDDATRAIDMIKSEHKFSAEISFDTCRLLVSNLPVTMTKSQIRSQLDKTVEGVVDVQLCYSSVQDSAEGCSNSAYAFVDFESHRSAAMGRRILLGNTKIRVDWAVPKNGPKETTLRLIPWDHNVTSNKKLIKSLLGSLFEDICSVQFGVLGHFPHRTYLVTFNNLDTAIRAYRLLRETFYGIVEWLSDANDSPPSPAFRESLPPSRRAIGSQREKPQESESSSSTSSYELGASTSKKFSKPPGLNTSKIFGALDWNSVSCDFTKIQSYYSAPLIPGPFHPPLTKNDQAGLLEEFRKVVHQVKELEQCFPKDPYKVLEILVTDIWKYGKLIPSVISDSTVADQKATVKIKIRYEGGREIDFFEYDTLEPQAQVLNAAARKIFKDYFGSIRSFAFVKKYFAP